MTAPGPDGPVTTDYGYDAAMNNTATIDPLGNVTTYTYDALTRETASYGGQVIDSGTAGYAESGSAWAPGATDKVGGTYDTATSVAGAATAAAAWTFSGLTPGDSYQLFTSWTAASGNSNASDVPFSISYTDADGNAQQTTEPVNESAPPAAGWSFSGQNFASLGAFTAGPDGTIVVQLSNSTGTAGQTVVADAVFLRRVQAMWGNLGSGRRLILGIDRQATTPP